MRSLLTSMIFLIMLGCATTGKKVDWDVVKTFQIGITTIQEVEGKLGQPTSKSTTSESTIMVWSWAYFSGSNVDSQMLGLKFNKEGILISKNEAH